MIKRLLKSNVEIASKSTQHYLEVDRAHLCNNYLTHPIVVERAEGIHIWDVTGKRYMDFVGGVAACSQGHCHPKIVQALIDQAQKVT